MISKSISTLMFVWYVIILLEADGAQSRKILRSTPTSQGEIPTSSLLINQGPTPNTHRTSIATSNSEISKNKLTIHPNENTKTTTFKGTPTINLTSDDHLDIETTKNPIGGTIVGIIVFITLSLVVMVYFQNFCKKKASTPARKYTDDIFAHNDSYYMSYSTSNTDIRAPLLMTSEES
ncbi:hypothetical protein TrispH2_001190 [Trichoplax sp. H2]|nr:hypothetical protein TrispH2_001190 [Trichoplax sp. H2]|eukprot:RDD46832.1 hypothetical protein TrispH2_001190 [Trichoplax sp. H2]